ncbi:MAG: hypothetical protein GX760_01560 [Erysipelothrix sp.]|nr:hypothetical protein [Erysipelothrix sp.]
MKVTNCARCNKEIEVKKMKDLEAIKCTHCNQVHVVSKKTRTLSYIVVGLLVFIMAMTISIITELFNINFYVLMIPAIIFGFFAYRMSLFLLAKLNKIQYVKEVK